MGLEQYKEKRETLLAQIHRLEKLDSRLSTARLVLFLLAAAGFLIGYFDNQYTAFILGVAFLVGFIGLVVYQSQINFDLKKAEAVHAVYEKYIARFDDGWKQFEDTGKDLLDQEDTVSGDLDILGENSLFQFLSVAHTQKGREFLKNALTKQNCTVEEIKKRQEAVRELVEKDGFSIEFEAAGMLLQEKKGNKGDVSYFTAFCKEEHEWQKGFQILGMLAPVVFFGIVLLWMAGCISFVAVPIYFFVLLGTSWLTQGFTNKILQPLFGVADGLEAYIDLLQLISNEAFQSEKLQELHKTVVQDGNAQKALEKLKAIGNAFCIRYNPIVHQILCGTLLWDFQLVGALMKWKKTYGVHMESWLNAIGEMELLLSLSVLAKVRHVSFPEVVKENAPAFSADSMIHPLLNPKEAVANSVTFSNDTVVITGSNMSGKTTFLRTIGMNLILAFAGAPVCGRACKATTMKIYTSMRIADDMSHGISTFYAEILRIKTMVNGLEEKKPMLCLIDEIFKGTNSADRIVGSREVLKKLSEDQCLTLVSTHDFELCELKDQKNKVAVNYHFEEFYKEDTLEFDYKLKEGRCTTTNALLLMKMAGL